MIIKSETKQKIILLLAAGVLLGLSRSPRGYFKTLDSLVKDWKEIERQKLIRVIREFHNERVVDYKERENGLVEIILTEKGKKKALIFKIDEIKIKKPEKWDGKWRVFIFDIPEKKKKAREALRRKIKDLEFKELQKSVFVYPYECADEINFIVEVFELRPYVKLLTVESFTNEEQFRLKFGLY